MRGTWVGSRCLAVVLVLAAGCWTTEPSLKPPPHPEEFMVPPDESRFSAPPVFPKEALKESPLKKNPEDTEVPGIGGPKPPSFNAGGPGSR